MKFVSIAVVLIGAAGTAGVAFGDEATEIAKLAERNRQVELAKWSRKLEEVEKAYKTAPRETDLNVARERATEHRREVADIKAKIAALIQSKGKSKPGVIEKKLEVGMIGYIKKPLKNIKQKGPTEFECRFPINGDRNDPEILVRGVNVAKLIAKSQEPGSENPPGSENEEKVEKEPGEKPPIYLTGLFMISGTNVKYDNISNRNRTVYIVEALDIPKANRMLEEAEKKLNAEGR